MNGRMKFLAVAAVFAAGASAGLAQEVASSGPASNAANSSYVQQAQPAPIERAYPDQNEGPYGQRGMYGRQAAPVTLAPGGSITSRHTPISANPIPGVWLRLGEHSSVKEVASDNQRLELRVESGIANVNVHDPQKDLLILVDLPGGQVQTLKNGLYTFNAATNTARVLKGEALAFPGSTPNSPGMKVKEYNKIVFGKDTRPHEFTPQEARADLIPGPPRGGQPYGGGAGYGYGPGYGPYGDGFYGYGAYGYPYWGYAAYPWWGWGWGDPWDYGFYPFGFGVGFGYYGGWGGFHGGGFHGGRR